MPTFGASPHRQREWVVVRIKPTAGGVDAKDWAHMLFRMYLRRCERYGYKAEIIDFQERDGPGIDGAAVIVSGAGAYAKLRDDHGTHRLVRHSPFTGARQTAFVAVEVARIERATADPDPSFGTQVRDYDLVRGRVRDLRTEVDLTDVDGVLDGAVDVTR